MNATVPDVFWSVIDAPGVRAGPLPEGLWPVLEDEVPVAPELLWAVGIPIEGERLAVGAIHRGKLNAIAPGTLRLTPAHIPDFIPVDPSRFNFLIGAFEPSPIRRARMRRHLAAAAATLACACLIAVGLARRTNNWRQEVRAAQQAERSVVASIAPTASPAHWTRDDLTLELQQRQQAAPTDLTPPADAAQALAALIARWPTQVPSKPQSISATGTAASISVTIPGDAQTFLASLKPPEGWTLDEPRLTAIDKATRLNLELHKAGEAR